MPNIEAANSPLRGHAILDVEENKEAPKLLLPRFVHVLDAEPLGPNEGEEGPLNVIQLPLADQQEASKGLYEGNRRAGTRT